MIKIGDTEFRICHTGPAHTDNAVSIQIVGENALFTGDVVRNRFLGMMVEDASCKGNFAAVNFLPGKNFRHYIPAPGRAGGIEILDEYRAYLVTLRDAVKTFYDDGLAGFEMKPELGNTLEVFKKWSGFDIR